MARRAFVVNDAVREKVRYLAGVGVRQDDIAKIIGCAPKTLRKRFRDELDRGVAEANATISGYLFAAAKARQCRGADLLAEDAGALAGEDGAGRPDSGQPMPRSNSEVVLVLPDNSRDPELTQVLQDAQEKYFARNTAAAAPARTDLMRTGSGRRATRADRTHRGHSAR